MQINPVLNQSSGISISSQAGADIGLNKLSEGDSITARVIFSGDGTAHLKTPEGGLIRARLDNGVTLPEGSQVTLTVEEKSGDNITLRIAAGSGQESSAAGRQQAPLPPALSAVLEQIQSSALPASQKADLFVKALADFPSLNTQSPAVQQALATLASGSAGQTTPQAGLGQMLVELAVLISNLEGSSAGGKQTPTQTNTISANITSSNTTPTPANPGTSAPVIITADSSAPANAGTPTTATPPGNTTNPAATAQAATTATAATAQAPAQVPAQAGQGPSVPNPPVATPGAPAATPSPPAAAPNPPAAAPGAAVAPAATQVTPNATPTAQAGAPGSPVAPAATPEAPAATPGAPAAPPQEALQTVRQMISELYPPGQQEPSPKALGEFIERLFAHVGRTVEQGGEELQKCARELEVRLNLLQEAISKSSLPQREELLNQTNRILQQTETLREARLLCLQIPIQFEQQKQTAELYVYRRERKAGKKLDPQNATILLALDTEHLGRLEALIQTRGKEINLKLEISREDAIPLVREYSQSLPRLLQEAGFRLNSSSIGHLQRERKTPQAAERALIDYQRNFDGKLDFFI